MSRWHIRNGHLIDPANGVDGANDLYIADGRIAGLGSPPEGFVADAELDAAGRWIVPGLIDTWARLREPGQEHKARIKTELRAAVAAGITTLCMPPDTDPVVDTRAVVKLLRQRSEERGLSSILPIGALTRGLEGKRLSEMEDLHHAGCTALSQADVPLNDTRVLRRAMEYAANLGLLIMLRPQDAWLAGNGCAHEGAVASRLGLPGIPAAAETANLAQLLELAAHTGCRLHFVNLSAGRSVNLLREAQEAGLRVSASVSAHQLWLTEMDIDAFDSNCHVLPPLRSERDRDQLRQGVADGVIEIVNSDHQPHEPDAKLAPFPSTEPGMSTLETLLPLTLKLTEQGILDRSTAIARLTQGPARLLGLEDRGQLGIGARADLCLVDPEALWTLEPQAMRSRGRNSAFRGWDFSHRATDTLVGGRRVFHVE